MTGLLIHPEVSEELAEAANWYRAIDAELGERFLGEIYQGIRCAQETPLTIESSSIHTAGFFAKPSRIGSFSR